MFIACTLVIEACKAGWGMLNRATLPHCSDPAYLVYRNNRTLNHLPPLTPLGAGEEVAPGEGVSPAGEVVPGGAQVLGGEVHHGGEVGPGVTQLPGGSHVPGGAHGPSGAQVIPGGEVGPGGAFHPPPFDDPLACDHGVGLLFLLLVCLGFFYCHKILSHFYCHHFTFFSSFFKIFLVIFSCHFFSCHLVTFLLSSFFIFH